MLSEITVNLETNSYQIAIAPQLINNIGSYLQSLPIGNKIIVVSNTMIFDHYGESLIKAIEKANFSVSYKILPDGERHKTLLSVQKIYDQALENYLERSSTLIALGGGVIGDMTGFAAATWLRGINVIQIPTSLLAMVDAAIGGKTGVNHPQGKNLIGAFHQPKLVLIDPEVLKTLPHREFRAGMAEVIKYGVIWSDDLFQQLESAQRLDQLDYLSSDLLQNILTQSCQAKADVVSQDEKEGGLRAILNYGHTVGHAIESLTGYRLVNHGEAVAIGMSVAGKIAVKMGYWSEQESQRQDQLILKTGLPKTVPPMLKVEDILETLKSDKKVKNGKVRFVLPQKIGAATVTDEVSPEIVKEAVKECQEST
ncbi:3-dehydroquinate synthase [Euhalothece natronophila Z-M001]|uniref:3-dehydroquinate synthase n=1 Tax=Euhalothece natronophila Z-M001 TaxID=522448 RepID=A0A5B8NRW4_9CHRO|nr:3-dehydroquinate synthase [Euhalothece natronophila]QDZ41059.1 3-dehydroquinate synthase [Euhalothece natronophila Z-M001]